MATRSSLLLLPALIALLPFGSGTLDAAPHPMRILRINPSGENVQEATQIVFQFDRPVVPLGRMDRDPGESYNVMKKYPEKGQELLQRIETFENEFAGNPRGWLPPGQ